MSRRASALEASGIIPRMVALRHRPIDQAHVPNVPNCCSSRTEQHYYRNIRSSVYTVRQSWALIIASSSAACSVPQFALWTLRGREFDWGGTNIWYTCLVMLPSMGLCLNASKEEACLDMATLLLGLRSYGGKDSSLLLQPGDGNLDLCYKCACPSCQST